MDVMDPIQFRLNIAFFVIVFYVFTYYLLARSILSKISNSHSEYADARDSEGRLPIGMSTSLSMWEMITDFDLPEREDGKFVYVGLWVVRILLVGYVPVFAALIYWAA